MAIKASSFYLLPSLLWTLQTGIGKKWQVMAKHTFTKSKSTCAQKRTHFSNFRAQAVLGQEYCDT